MKPTHAEILAYRKAKTIDGIPPTVYEIAEHFGCKVSAVREAIRSQS